MQTQIWPGAAPPTPAAAFKSSGWGRVTWDMEIGLKWLKHWCSKCVFCFLRTGYQGCDHHIMQQNIYRVKASISCYVGIRQAIGVPFWTLTNGWNMWIERNIYILRIVFDFDPPKHPPSLNNCAYTDIYIYMYIDLKPLAAACTCKIYIYIYIHMYTCSCIT